jgi:hypothetical protein
MYNNNMTGKIRLLLILFALSTAVFAQAQSEQATSGQGGDFWISLNGDAAMYGSEGFAFGGGIALGYGSGASIGLKAMWYFSSDQINTLEINFIVRFYIQADKEFLLTQGSRAYSGPFIQFMGGPTFYGYMESASIPSEIGMISAGFSFGWRFLFIDRWFVEPSVRAGYPYIVAAGIAAGVRF